MPNLLKSVLWGSLAMVIAYSAQANDAHHSASSNNSSVNQSEQQKQAHYRSKGIVKAIDTQQQKLSISHEAIPEISWPPMTMNFIYTPAAETVKILKPGDAIDFIFTQQGNDYVLQSIEIK